MRHGWLVLGGFLLGTAGTKAVMSRPFKRVLARVTACGLEAKEYVDYVVDETKAQCDDILAEAKVIKAQDEEKSVVNEEIVIEEVSKEEEDPEPAKSTAQAKKATPPKRTRKRAGQSASDK